MEKAKQPSFGKLIEKLTYASHILPYFGYIDQGCALLIDLNTETRKLIENSIGIFKNTVFTSKSQWRILKLKLTQKSVDAICNLENPISKELQCFSLEMNAKSIEEYYLLIRLLSQLILFPFSFRCISLFITNENAAQFTECFNLILKKGSIKFKVRCDSIEGFEEGQTIKAIGNESMQIILHLDLLHFRCGSLTHLSCSNAEGLDVIEQVYSVTTSNFNLRFVKLLSEVAVHRPPIK